VSRAAALFDSHCHLHDRRVEDADAQIARAGEAGVTGFLLAGVDPEGWQDELALQARFPSLCLSYGVHPQIVASVGERAVEMVDELAAALAGGLPRPSALGETGLDGLDQNRASLPLQEQLFRRQLALAVDHRLPLVLHVLRAHPQALSILSSVKLPEQRGVLHSCSASADLVKQYVALGFSISFSGAVANPTARRIHAAAQAVPLDRLLIETDAPDQTPMNRRPARNEPAFLVEILAALAQIRGEPADVLAQASSENARRLFQKRDP
jgi:TatD DNase family protein